MRLTRLVLLAAAAAGASYYLKGRGLLGVRERLSLGGGMGAAAPAGSTVAETMWTPSGPDAEHTPDETPAAPV